MKQVLEVTLSKLGIQEKKHTLSWVLDEILGFDIQWKIMDRPEIKIELSGSDKKLLLSDSVFQYLNDHWLESNSIPKLDLVPFQLELESKKINSISLFQLNKHPIELVDSNQIKLNFDLFGTIFFLISRYEEAVSNSLDKHQRFLSTHSILQDTDLIEKPIGNEYIDFLWRAMEYLWPELIKKTRTFRLLPSHDIDHPSYYWNKSLATIGKKSLGDILKRKKITLGISRFYNGLLSALDKNYSDLFDLTDWIIDQSEKNNTKSAFYYIPIKTHEYDPGMPIDHCLVSDQWGKIHSRGHEIGYHPGYMTYNSPELLKRGLNVLKNQLEKLNINYAHIGSRQHVLRWKTSTTARFLDNLKIKYDTTLGYADKIGFRCGVCYEFPMYDLENRKSLKLIQRPLVVMDVTALDSKYMNLELSEAYDKIVKLKRSCQKHAGDFTILWHNTELLTEPKKELYNQILHA